MEPHGPICGVYTFKGVECAISMTVTDNNQLTVEVEDRTTSDQWRASFDAAYLEDLTHKTGNYKQFKIFVNMLETAISATSDTVTLELLTYSDLEKLRSRKANAVNATNARHTSLTSKRYLILTYTVEFDRIHYPLPLPYVGKVDPKILQETVQNLRAEIKSLRQRSPKDYKSKELDKLKINYERLAQEKEDIEAEFLTFRRELKLTKLGSAAKEIRILKDIVKNLEEDLLKETSKNTRTSNRRNQEYRQMMDELDEVKASERTLKARVKSLTNEISVYRRNPNHSISSRGRSALSNGYSSRENSFSKDNSRNGSRLSSGSYYRNRSLERNRSLDRNRSKNSSQERKNSFERPRSRLRDKPLHLRDRSSSWERTIRDRSTSRERSRVNTSGGSSSYRRPSPVSCAGARYPRFDPSAYIKEKQQKKHETESKYKRQTRRRMSGGFDHNKHSPTSDRSVGRISRISRTSSAGSLRSRTSSVESLSDVGLASDASDGRNTRKSSKILRTMKPMNNAWSSPDVSYSSKPEHRKDSKSRTKTILSSTPESIRTKSKLRKGKENLSDAGDDNELFDRSSEIGEIDARLNRLQEFMKNNL